MTPLGLLLARFRPAVVACALAAAPAPAQTYFVDGTATVSGAGSGIAGITVVPVTVTFMLYRSDGTLLGQGTHTLAPLDWFQASTIFSFLGVASSETNAYVTVSSANASFFAYGSLVDQTTGDGTVIEAVGY
jgi:hypothetical protein